MNPTNASKPLPSSMGFGGCDEPGCDQDVSGCGSDVDVVVAADEIDSDRASRQSFVTLRKARARDVAIDTFGALLVQTLVWFYATQMWKFVVQSGAAASTTKE